MKMARCAVAVMMLVLCAGFVFAQGADENMPPQPPQQSGQPNCNTMDKKPPMMSMNMGGMMPKSMVSSNDGGVIILSGNKLMKYDKDLNLVKEVEIKGGGMEMKFDPSQMKDMMQQMKDKYGKHKDEAGTAPAAETK